MAPEKTPTIQITMSERGLANPSRIQYQLSTMGKAVVRRGQLTGSFVSPHGMTDILEAAVATLHDCSEWNVTSLTPHLSRRHGVSLTGKIQATGGSGALTVTFQSEGQSTRCEIEVNYRAFGTPGSFHNQLLLQKTKLERVCSDLASRVTEGPSPRRRPTPQSSPSL